MKIGLLTSVCFNNIGNAFIDLGAEATIKAAVPDATIVKVSSFANYAATMGFTFRLKENPIVYWLWSRIMQKFVKQLHDKTYVTVEGHNVFSPAKVAKLDYLIIPGCVFTKAYMVIYGQLLKEKVEQGTKIVFWGASGNYYTKEEINEVTKWLERLKPYAICTRDSVAYKYYSSYTSKVFNGVDNVFFVNRLGMPKVETEIDPYIAINFDEPKHKKIGEALKKKYGEKNIVITNHKPTPFVTVNKMVKKNVMVSECPLDYLFIYNNTQETHTDRVHACIPTLSFGNYAQLYSESPRIALFENAGLDINELKRKPTQIDLNKLKELQDKQIDFLRSILV